MQYLKPFCDNCKQRFEFKDPKERVVADGITEVYFECDNCGHKYHSYYLDKETKKLIKRNNSIRELIKAKGEKVSDKILEELDENIAHIRGKQDELKAKVEGSNQ